jgi:hypothetical protein
LSFEPRTKVLGIDAYSVRIKNLFSGYWNEIALKYGKGEIIEKKKNIKLP